MALEMYRKLLLKSTTGERAVPQLFKICTKFSSKLYSESKRKESEYLIFKRYKTSYNLIL